MYRYKKQYLTKKALKAFNKGKTKILTDVRLNEVYVCEFSFKGKNFLYTKTPIGTRIDEI